LKRLVHSCSMSIHSPKLTSTTSSSLFILYSILTRQGSPVKLSRVHFHGVSEAVAGLVATRPIPAFVDLLSTGGLMACDAPYDFDGSGQDVLDDRLKLSVVTPNTKALGPDASRITLGPMRFANHACDPNAEVCPSRSQHRPAEYLLTTFSSM
jgi:hypothetical protein